MRKIVNSMVVYTFGNSKNQPIIFVHGFPFDHNMWHNQISQLQKDYYCISYDIRGLGESYVGDGQYTMEAYVDDLFSIIDKLGIQKPVLCGLSMGGYIILRAAEKSPESFMGLILCSTRAEADDDKGKLGRADKINQINVEGLEKFANEFVANLFAEETVKNKSKLFYEIINSVKQNNPLGVKGALIAMLCRTSTVKFLRKIKIPVLLIAGSLDKLISPKMMKAMADKINESEFAITPRAGHMTALENPGFVNDVIKGFLKRRI
ncbi:alpha/beta fold hydrolase [Bacteroidota bacterium]